MFGRRETVNGRRLKNGLLVVILRSLPQADDEESQLKRDSSLRSE